MFAIFSLLCSCAREHEEIQPTAESLLKRVRQHLGQFTEADLNSFEYFEAIFKIRFACEDYSEFHSDDESNKCSDLLRAELSDSDLNKLFDFIEDTILWERLPTAAEFELMVERGEITKTPPKYQISRSKQLRSTIHSAEKIFVYEGFLRGAAVRDFGFESFTHEGQEFTLPKQPIEPERNVHLLDLFGTEKFFNDWGGGKACGGFSADYMIEWDFEGTPVRVMVCNGCYEIIITYKDQWFMHDFDGSKASEIKQVMARFDQKRTQMREAIASESAPKPQKGFTEEEKAEIRAALKGEK